jgi:nucleoside-diphosphate-sugar epimerase
MAASADQYYRDGVVVARACVIFGASGGIGSALVRQLRAGSCFEQVIELYRTSQPPMDLLEEDTVSRLSRIMHRQGRASSGHRRNRLPI